MTDLLLLCLLDRHLLNIKTLNYVPVYFMWVCAHGCSAWRDQKRALDLLQLELTVVMSLWMWVLGANLRSSVIMYMFLTTEPSLHSLLNIFYF